MLKHFAGLSLLIFLLAACETSKKATIASQKIAVSRQTIARDSLFLDSLELKMTERLANNSIDTAIKNNMYSIVAKLQADLRKIEETINAADLIAQKRSNFKGKKYNTTIRYFNQIDSFQLKSSFRDHIYQLLSEAVSVNAFRKYQMGTFFDPGAYKIPHTAIQKVSESFQPAIDSIISQSNKYADLRRRIYIVLVGYADALPINPNTSLYKELKTYINTTDPDKEQLNLMLSSLRANELLQNMKILVKENAVKFRGFNQLNIAYVGYGRGEAFPFKNITNYRDDDERRRVVVFYWSILPDL